MSKTAPWFVLLFVTLMASGVFVIIKILAEYVTPVEMLLMRFLPASIFSVILVLIFYRKPFGKIVPKMWGFFLIREAVAVLGFHLTLIYCGSELPAGITALIIGIWPVMTMFLASPTLGEKITILKVIGACLGFGGVAAVVLIGAGPEARGLDMPAAQWMKYSLILLIAPVSAAVVTIITRWYLSYRKEEEHPDSFLFSLICRVPSGIFVLIAYLLFREPVSLIDKLPDLPGIVWILAGVLAFHNSLLGFWLWNWSIQKLPAANVSSFSYIQTAFALVVALVFLGEEINLLKIIGALAIISGAILANIERWKKDTELEVASGQERFN